MKLLRNLLLCVILLAPVAVEAKRWAQSSDFECMVANLYFEARGESVEGMKAVAAVTMNRVKSKKYPPTVCAVIFQKKQFSWTHQKSWWAIQRIMRGSTGHLKGKDLQAYQNAVIIAQKAVKSELATARYKGSMYYHAKYVNPKWNRKMQVVAVVGNHIFYKG